MQPVTKSLSVSCHPYSHQTVLLFPLSDAVPLAILIVAIVKIFSCFQIFFIPYTIFKTIIMKHLLALLCFLAFSPSVLRAQEVISSGGTHAAGSGVVLSWTVGETVIATLGNGSYTLTQGFHQTRLSATAIDDLPAPGLILTVYPNPMIDILHLRVDEGDFSRLKFVMLSMEGKSLLTKTISKKLTDIDMQTFAPGNYLLQVRRKSGEIIKTFQVTKN